MFAQEPFRLAPTGPVTAYKSYEFSMPPGTHTRPATCEQVDCPTQASGWITPVDESTTLGQKQAHYIRRLSGRIHTEGPRDVFTLFTFPPGEECFDTHTVALDRDPIFVVRGGDWRGNPRRERMTHDRPDYWVEDFAEHQDRLATRISRG